MAHAKLDHFYLSVEIMDRAVGFYEDLLGMKITPYRCFQCKDTEGNLIEVAQYERK